MSRFMLASGGRIAAPIANGGTGSIFGTMTFQGGNAGAYNGNTNQSVTASAASGVIAGGGSFAYVGRSFGSPRAINRAIVYGSNDAGFDFNHAAVTVSLNLCGRNGAAPSSPFDGTVLGSISFAGVTNESGGHTINSSDTTTVWDHCFISITDSGTNNYYIIGQVVPWVY